MDNKLKEGASSLHIPELDGIRGTAILMVLLSHTAAAFGTIPHDPILGFVHTVLKLGWAGVDLFFVLSGFLITGILVDQKVLLYRQPRKYFGYFYARRSLRIFPLYYASIILILLVVPLFEGKSADFGVFTIHAFYLQNIILDYPMALSHFWSLAVEEHFYLILPLIIYFTPRNALGWVILAGVILSVVSRILLAETDLNVYRFSLTRFDSLLMGGLLALEARRESGFVKHSGLLLLASATLLCSFLIYTRESNNQAYVHRTIGYSLFALLFTCLIRNVLANNQGSVLAKFFALPFLRFCGKLSYCVYVVHWPIFLVVKRVLPPDGRSWLSSAIIYTVLTGLASFGIAGISWKYFESRILHFRKHFRPRSREKILLNSSRKSTGS